MILVSFIDRFLSRLNYPSHIVVDKSRNYAGMGGIETGEFLQVGSHGIVVRDVRNRNLSERPNQHFDETKQEETGISFDNNRERNFAENKMSPGTVGIPGNTVTINKEQQHQSWDIFKHNWCRLQGTRIEWKEVLGPCLNLTAWEVPNKVPLGVNQITDPSKSFISHWEIRKAGEFSRFVIQTVSTNNVTKAFGGDSWRIHIQGPSSLAPAVLDLKNGTYEVLFLIIEDGDYEAKIFLDYSLCHGFKDPPPYWFRKGKVFNF